MTDTGIRPVTGIISAQRQREGAGFVVRRPLDRKSTRLNSSH